jgi:NADPH-dependent glutamate synthase beta subunit-like oxidoreductase/Pyruvate/2-oxoacid:ferredoxin oxidoreductase delta subunit
MQPVFTNRTAPCRDACPAGTDIATLMDLSSRGLYQDALSTILKENPFPAVCGHVCYHPCEGACNRSRLDDALAIHVIERFVGNQAIHEKRMPAMEKTPPKGIRVAVIGSGPSGLAAAYFLNRLGYDCDVFESEKEPGGLLRWGIPTYRLPPAVLKHEVARIQNLGVRIICNRSVSASFLQTAREHYRAIFVGCGLGHPVPMQIPGETHALDGLTTLKALRHDQRTSYKGISAVIGGGNTAIDVARSLVRLGSQPIILYRRRIQDMPAFDQEIEVAQQEGVQIRELIAPLRIEKQDGSMDIQLQKMAVDDHETEDGRAWASPIQGETETLRVARIFRAIGAEADMAWQPQLKKNPSMMSLSHCTLSGDDFPIAYGGDLVNRQLRVGDAIASGKQAAMAIDAYFQAGWDCIEGRLAGSRVGPGTALSMQRYLVADEPRQKQPALVDYQDINTAYFLPAERKKPKTTGPEADRLSFSDGRPDYTTRSASEEAGRCFNCGMCTDCDNCDLFCPETAVLATKPRRIDMDYCKGCGVCVEECPRGAMTLEEMVHETGS